MLLVQQEALSLAQLCPASDDRHHLVAGTTHDPSWVSTGLPGRPHATKQLQEEQVVQQQGHDRHHLLLVQSHIKPSSLQEEQPLVHLSSAAAGPHDRSWVLTELPGRPHATKQLQEEQVVQQQVALRMAHHLRLLAHKQVALLQLSRKHSVLCSR